MLTTTNTVLSSTLSSRFQTINTITFSWIDYVLFTLMLLISALVGIYFGCFGSKEVTTSEYLMGSKKMNVFPISMSLVASHISGITLLALPADVYRFGAGYLISIVSFFLTTIVTMKVYLPVFCNLKITSTYEYLERRFDRRTRVFSSFLFTLSQFLFLPIVVYIPALAFSAATQVNLHLITPIVCSVCIFYTTIGGLKAVVWTDTLQFTVTLGAVTAVIVLGVKAVGGFTYVWQKAIQGQRLDIFDFDFDVSKRDQFWALAVGYTVHVISLTNTNQGCVQKFLSVPNLKDAQLVAVYYAVGIATVQTCSVFTGLLIYSRYSDCDPFATKQITRNDQLLPYYVLDVAGKIPGLPGLFISGVFSAGLSTLSAHLNCLSGTIYEDFVAQWMPTHTSEKAKGNILKIIVIVCGVICTALVFIFEHLGGILPLSIAFNGVTAGPLLGMFTLGVLSRKANSKGAFYGGIFGLIFITWFVMTAQYYKTRGMIQYPEKPLSTDQCDFLRNVTTSASSTIKSLPLGLNSTTSSTTKDDPSYIFRISHYYYTFLGSLLTLITGLTISHFTEMDNKIVDEELFSPVLHKAMQQNHDITRKNIQYNTVDQTLDVIVRIPEKEYVG